MNYEVKSFKYICDLCKDEAIYQGKENKLPHGWVSKMMQYRDNHYPHKDYCGSCARALKNRGEL
jgi:hypothetical protein